MTNQGSSGPLYALPQTVLCNPSDDKGSTSLSHDIDTAQSKCLLILSFTRIMFCRSLCVFLSLGREILQSCSISILPFYCRYITTRVCLLHTIFSAFTLCHPSDNRGSPTLLHKIDTAQSKCSAVLSFSWIKFCLSLCAFLSIQQY